LASASGLAGVAILQTGGDLRANPAGALVLTVSCASWALGSIYSRRLPLPEGLMASAAQMLAGGVVMLVLGLLYGERMTAVPSARLRLALRVSHRRRIDRPATARTSTSSHECARPWRRAMRT